jgi:DNA end-binding protein Ku
MSTLYYPDEVVSQDDLEGLPSGDVSASERELAMAQQLIEALSNEFEPDKYHDEYREQLLALIDQKAAGAEVIELPERPAAAANVTDLMAALEASIASARKDKPAKSA